MAEITINGVKYTNVPNKKAGTKFAASLTQSNIGASQAVQDYVNSSYFYPLVNAIDINWNGVEVDENSYINSTSDLITYIATKGSNVDLTSYATKSYVDQKIEDVVGGAPETLDTLKELADALANDATLAYVTEALDGKADKSSLDDYATVAYVTTELDKKADLSDIPSAPDLTPYATVSYVTEELDKKVDISDIPVIPDMTNYVTYTDANAYYVAKEDMPVIPDMSSYVTTNTNQTITGGKTFDATTFIKGTFPTLNFANYQRTICALKGNQSIYTQQDQSISSSFIINSHHGTIGLKSKEKTFYIPYGDDFNAYFSSNIGFCIPIAFKDNNNNYITANKYGIIDLSSVIPSAPDLTPYATVSYVTTELENKADASDIPDMTNYVDVTSYNALYTEVQRLAYLISYYHPSSPDPGPGPDPGQQFEGYWTLNGVRTDSITLSETDPAVTLSFVSNPTIASGIGTWTFYDNNPKVIINTSTGEMTINPSLLGAGTVYSGAGYLYQKSESIKFNITITITSASKSPATGYFVDGNGNSMNMPLVWSDEGGELDGMSATLVSEPASGWTGPVVSYTSNDLQSGSDYTISGNTITFGNIQSPPNVSTFTWSYVGDSLYDMGSVELKVVGLQYGADTQFFPDCGNSSTIEIPAETDVFYFNLINRTGIDYVQHPISVSSDNQNVTVTSGPSNSFYITNTSTGTSQYANITATITDGNDTHTTSFEIEFLPSLTTPTCYWSCDGDDYNNGNSTGWTVDEERTDTFTFTGTPTSGWTFNYPTGTGITANTTTGEITIDTTAISSKGTYTLTASYPGDSTYSSAQYSITIILEKRATAVWKDSNDVGLSQFETNVNGGMTILTFDGTPSTGWTFNDNGVAGISIDASGNITVEPLGMTPDTYWISAEYPEDATYSNTYASFAIVIYGDSSQPAQEYTNVSILYSVPTTGTTNLPQGTFDTNPFEIGNMGNTLEVKVEFSGSEYDMNNFNTDFVLTRDTSYAGNYSLVNGPLQSNNTYINGVNTITFDISMYSVDSEIEGTNRDVLTFTHNGYNYLTDGIKSHVTAGGPT